MFIKYYKSKGVITRVGYTGGDASDPSYRAVCSGITGHAEACRVEFDPSKVTYPELVEFFYRTHDPTTVDSQGADRGTRKYLTICLIFGSYLRTHELCDLFVGLHHSWYL